MNPKAADPRPADHHRREAPPPRGHGKYYLAYSNGVPDGKPRKVNLLSMSLREKEELRSRWLGPNNEFQLHGCFLKAHIAKKRNTVFFRHARGLKCDVRKYHDHAVHDAYRDAVLSSLIQYGVVVEREKWTKAMDARSDIVAYTSRGRRISVEIQRSYQPDVIADRRTDARLTEARLVVWILRGLPTSRVEDSPNRLFLFYDEEADDQLMVRSCSRPSRGAFHAGRDLGEALARDKLFYHQDKELDAGFPAHWCGLPLACPAMGTARGGAA